MLSGVEHEKSFITSGPGYYREGPWKTVDENQGSAIQEKSPYQPSSKRVPVLNWGKIRQKKERDGLCLSYALPMIVGSGL